MLYAYFQLEVLYFCVLSVCTCISICVCYSVCVFSTLLRFSTMRKLSFFIFIFYMCVLLMKSTKFFQPSVLALPDQTFNIITYLYCHYLNSKYKVSFI